MSVSQHPIALRLERRVGGAARLLATVMALPLIDGIFVALILAGTLNTAFGILETGLLIFGGSATLAVILAEMEGSPRQQVTAILLIGAVILPLAAVEATLAVTIESVLNMEIFERFAGLVILAIAAKTASSKVGDVLPGPGVIIALGLVASLEPNGLTLELLADPELIARAVAAAGVGVAFALAVALTGPKLRGNVDIDRFRFGSSVALGVLALPILGLMNTDAPIALAVLVVTALFAYDPDAGEIDSPVGSDDDRGDSGAATVAQEGGAAPGAVTDGGDDDELERRLAEPTATPRTNGNGSGHAAGASLEADPEAEIDPEAVEVAANRKRDDVEGGEEESESEAADERDSEGGDVGYGYHGEDDSRAPWL